MLQSMVLSVDRGRLEIIRVGTKLRHLPGGKLFLYHSIPSPTPKNKKQGRGSITQIRATGNRFLKDVCHWGGNNMSP